MGILGVNNGPFQFRLRQVVLSGSGTQNKNDEMSSKFLGVPVRQERQKVVKCTKVIVTVLVDLRVTTSFFVQKT